MNVTFAANTFFVSFPELKRKREKENKRKEGRQAGRKDGRKERRNKEIGGRTVRAGAWGRKEKGMTEWREVRRREYVS